MDANAVILTGPKDLQLDALPICDPTAGDLVVDIHHSGISTGTEKLLWTGEMPPFPGMGYPLVPGYEAAGEVVEASPGTGFKPGDTVFVPGSNCINGARSLFGGAASRLVTSADRVSRIDAGMGAEGALLALAATARHAVAGIHASLPELIVGHGVLGRLLARLTVAAGGPAPTVWDVAPNRMDSDGTYDVLNPDDDPRRDYRSIYDASGDASLLNNLIARLQKGGEVVLAGFYPQPINFAFPPAFMKEARLRIAAEWNPDDLVATRQLVDSGALSLAGLITHRHSAHDAPNAYSTAFNDDACLKMILDWSAQA